MDKLERRVFTHPSEDELPSTATLVTSSNLGTVSFNVLYLPRAQKNDSASGYLYFKDQNNVVKFLLYDDIFFNPSGTDGIINGPSGGNRIEITFRYSGTSDGAGFMKVYKNNGSESYLYFSRIGGLISGLFPTYDEQGTTYFSKIKFNRTMLFMNSVSSFNNINMPIYIDNE